MGVRAGAPPARPRTASAGLCHVNRTEVTKIRMLGSVRPPQSQSPGLCCLGPEDPKSAAGDEMALKVERVVDGSMHREKVLG